MTETMTTDLHHMLITGETDPASRRMRRLGAELEELGIDHVWIHPSEINRMVTHLRYRQAGHSPASDGSRVYMLDGLGDADLQMVGDDVLTVLREGRAHGVYVAVAIRGDIPPGWAEELDMELTEEYEDGDDCPPGFHVYAEPPSQRIPGVGLAVGQGDDMCSDRVRLTVGEETVYLDADYTAELIAELARGLTLLDSTSWAHATDIEEVVKA